MGQSESVKLACNEKALAPKPLQSPAEISTALDLPVILFHISSDAFAEYEPAPTPTEFAKINGRMFYMYNHQTNPLWPLPTTLNKFITKLVLLFAGEDDAGFSLNLAVSIVKKPKRDPKDRTGGGGRTSEAQLKMGLTEGKSMYI